MEGREFDVIIAGGSFAGLTTAFFTEAERILILEKEEELGARQRSTCGTLVEWVERLGAGKSILRRFDTLTFHSPGGYEVQVPMSVPYCTIDYRVFCRAIASRLKNVEIKTGTRVTGAGQGSPKRVYCGDRAYSSEILVDASGWRAAVARGLRPGHVTSPPIGRGIETEAEYEDDGSIHIYFGRRLIPGGYAWVFPISRDVARVGLGSFKRLNLLEYNKRFMDFLGIKDYKSGHHGGVIPSTGLRDPVVGGAFMVGDSGGQVIPGSGEGIRKALDYGEVCGRLISKVLAKELDLQEALGIYRDEVMKAKGFFDTGLFIQSTAFRAPDWAWDRAIRKMARHSTLPQRIFRAYFEGDVSYTRFEMVVGALRFLLRG
jgi:digeranylgeranylglycerophospholipid reductase